MGMTPNESEAGQTTTKPESPHDGSQHSVQLLEKARADTDAVLKELGQMWFPLDE